MRVEALAVACALLAACQSQDLPRGSQHQVEARRTRVKSTAVGSQLGAFEAQVPTRTPHDAADRLWKMALLLGQPLDETIFTDAAQGVAPGKAWHISGGSSVAGMYSPMDDFALVADEAIANSAAVADDVPDRGPEAARATAAKTVAQLSASGVTHAGDFSVDHASIAPQLAGLGRSDQPALASAQIIAYQVVMLRQLDGIPFYNRRLTVHVRRDGALAGVVLFGPTVNSQRTADGEQPTGAGFEFARTVSDAAIDARHDREAPDRVGETTAVMYMLPLEATHGVIEPLRIFSYTPRFTNGKRTSLARRQCAGYSLRDGNAPPVYATEASPSDPGDPRE